MGYVHFNIIIMWKTRNYGKGKLLQQGYNTGDMWSFRNIIFFYFTVIFSYNGIRQELCKLTLSSPKHREQEAKESIHVPYKVSFYKQICFMHLSVILYSLNRQAVDHTFVYTFGRSWRLCNKHVLYFLLLTRHLYRYTLMVFSGPSVLTSEPLSVSSGNSLVFFSFITHSRLEAWKIFSSLIWEGRGWELTCDLSVGFSGGLPVHDDRPRVILLGDRGQINRGCSRN